MKKILILLIKIYQLTLSPYLGRNCRFYPTCSAYAIEAISRFGAIKGSILAVKRLLKCHPFCHQTGIDEVPTEFHLINFKKRK